MPKPNLAKYDPKAESSPGAREHWKLVRGVGHDPEKTLVLIQPTESSCPCGCLQSPEGTGRTFRMGHDARLKGKLIRAHLTDTPVALIQEKGEKGKVVHGTALKLAKKFGWERFLADAAEREAARAKEREERASQRSQPRTAGPKVGDQAKIKVGRWEKDATVVGVFGDSIEYEYVDGKGKTQRTTKPRNA